MYLSIFFLFIVLYGSTSGLHAHMYGHAWLGVVCCCWHIAVGCCTLLWYPVCLLVLANHRRRIAGCLANKLHCLLYSFWFFTNWWSQKHIWWNVLDKSLVTGVLELSPWLVLHICSDVDPSSSPCLKTIDRKSFERGNFLVLHPVLPYISYFKSANWQLSIDVQPKGLWQRKIVDPSRAAP